MPEDILKRICDLQEGLFPSGKELRFSCSCPDWAVMCKHVAAACYGIGARLDHSPELFFTLRQVDMNELLADNMAAAAEAPAARGAKVLAGDGLEALFGLDMGGGAPTPSAADRAVATKKAAVKKPKAAVAKKKPTKAVPLKKSVDKPVRKAVKKAGAPAIAKKAAGRTPSGAGTKGKAAAKPVRKAIKKTAGARAIDKKAVAKKTSMAGNKGKPARKPLPKGMKKPVAKAAAVKQAQAAVPGLSGMHAGKRTMAKPKPAAPKAAPKPKAGRTK